MNDEPTSTLSESRVYALLARRRRRLIVRILQDFETPIAASELAEILADCEYERATDRHYRHVRSSLYHNHLPRLDDAGVVDYDRECETVRPDSNFGVLVGMITDEWEDNGPFAD